MYFQIIFLFNWKWLGLDSVLTFFKFINHSNCEGTRVTIFLVFLLSSFPGLALDTTSCCLTCAQLSLESDKYACSQNGLKSLHINIPRLYGFTSRTHTQTHTHLEIWLTGRGHLNTRVWTCTTATFTFTSPIADTLCKQSEHNKMSSSTV